MADLDLSEYERKFNEQWSFISQQASLHPKTAITVSLVIGVLVGWFLPF